MKIVYLLNITLKIAATQKYVKYLPKIKISKKILLKTNKYPNSYRKKSHPLLFNGATKTNQTEQKKD